MWVTCGPWCWVLSRVVASTCRNTAFSNSPTEIRSNSSFRFTSRRKERKRERERERRISTTKNRAGASALPSLASLLSFLPSPPSVLQWLLTCFGAALPILSIELRCHLLSRLIIHGVLLKKRKKKKRKEKEKVSEQR